MHREGGDRCAIREWNSPPTTAPSPSGTAAAASRLVPKHRCHLAIEVAASEASPCPSPRLFWGRDSAKRRERARSTGGQIASGASRSSSSRQVYRASTSIVATELPPPAVTFSSGAGGMRVSAPSVVAGGGAEGGPGRRGWGGWG